MTEEELQDLSRAAASKLPVDMRVPGLGHIWLHESNEACAEIAVCVLATKYFHYEVCGADDRAGCYYFDAPVNSSGILKASETEDQGSLMRTWRVATLRAVVAL